MVTVCNIRSSNYIVDPFSYATLSKQTLSLSLSTRMAMHKRHIKTTWN